jgi:hypothetical protein
MKEFLVGLLFLMAVFLFAAIAFLLYPLIIVTGFFVRFKIIFAFFIFVIWLLGKMILVLWKKLK